MSFEHCVGGAASPPLCKSGLLTSMAADLDPARISADLSLVSPLRLAFIVSALVCKSQAQPGSQLQIAEQMWQNTVTVGVSPGSVQSIQFALRPQTAGSDQIYIKSPDKSLGLNLRLPNGVVISPTTADAAGLRWKDEFGVWVLGLCEGASSWNIITLPPGALSGTYTIEAKLPQNAAQTRLCATSFTLGTLDAEALKLPAIGDWIHTDRRNYQVGDPVRISTPILEGGQPVNNAQVDAVISYQEGMSLRGEAGRIVLKDGNGTGSYVGVLQPLKPAHYVVQVTISGRNQTQTGGFIVGPASGSLVSAELSTVDRQPRATLRFRITAAGQYKITPLIRSSNGKSFSYPILEDLEPGEHDVIWPLDRKSLNAVGATSPLELIEIHVIRMNPSAPTRADFVGRWIKLEGRWVPQ